MTALKARKKEPTVQNFYSGFDRLDGSHPWMSAMPQGFVGYRVRELKNGKVTYFNFSLAKEMGLIEANHPNEMTTALEKKLLQTFALQIINEYDLVHNTPIDPHTVKPNIYMASRYLQLQHEDKKGRTSGDGRGIWNGVVTHKGITWDVSSRGTGVTRLSPGFVKAQKPLATGQEELGYGCGKAEIDELYACAIASEIMHHQGINTERVLLVIDLGQGYGIGVRAGQNLLRPAHLFLYLKQNRLRELKTGLDYFIRRQIKNRRFRPSAIGPQMYQQFLLQLAQDFARFVAQLDRDYIFAWLDWDGDNVLMDPGIIDYGSIRQFGVRHDRYRYDDIERFSTNLSEQKTKARQIVQVFVQLVDAVVTGQKKSLVQFKNDPVLKQFDKLFIFECHNRLLYRLGLDKKQRHSLLTDHWHKVVAFAETYSYFECAKVSGSPEKVADGVNHPALFDLRVTLRELTQFYQKGISPEQIDQDGLFRKSLSLFAKRRDVKRMPKHGKKMQKFITQFFSLLELAQIKNANAKHELQQRCFALNSDERITGNALIMIVSEILEEQARHPYRIRQTQTWIDAIISRHRHMPEGPQAMPSGTQTQNLPRSLATLIHRFHQLALEYRHDI